MRNNKLKQVFQSTTIRNRREISQNENGIIVVSHRETTIIPTNTNTNEDKNKNSNTFYCVTVFASQ